MLRCGKMVDFRRHKDSKVKPDRVFIGVAERQEGEKNLPAFPDHRKPLPCRGDIAEDGPMAEHNTLGMIITAGSVDDAGQAFLIQC